MTDEERQEQAEQEWTERKITRALEVMQSARHHELVKRLNECNSGDPEADHSQADSLLIWYINSPEVNEAYNAIDKWYA